MASKEILQRFLQALHEESREAKQAIERLLDDEVLLLT
jgi:hypothetical protein